MTFVSLQKVTSISGFVPAHLFVVCVFSSIPDFFRKGAEYYLELVGLAPHLLRQRKPLPGKKSVLLSAWRWRCPHDQEVPA